jgi:hypothetical protein
MQHWTRKTDSQSAARSSRCRGGAFATVASVALVVGAGATMAFVVGAGPVPVGGCVVTGTTTLSMNAAPIHDRVEARAGARPPVVSFYGPLSAITERQYLLITSRDEFVKVWERHMGDRAVNLLSHGNGVIAPRIDFERYMVVAHFRGESFNCNGDLASYETLDDRVRIRFDAMTFQTSAGFGERDPGERVTPYGIWVIPRTDKAIVLEENTQGLIGGEPVWTERMRFEGR